MTDYDLALQPSDRGQFNLRLGQSHRDRIIAAWLDRQIAQGFDASQQIKDMLYEVITGVSALTGRPLALSMPPEPRGDPLQDPLLQKLASFED
jgi:hypothetical protein